jgi:anti-sigma factor RsiW
VAELSDEMLMAYADGALDPADRAIVEAALADRLDYQEKLQKFRVTGTPVRQALLEGVDPGDLEALAARIRDVEEPSVMAPGHQDQARIVALAGRQTPASSTAPRAYWPTAMAASLALLIGGGFGWLAHGAATVTRPASPDVVAFWEGNLQAEGTLAKLLETIGSGNAVAVNDAHGQAWDVTASFSFRSMDGRPCRRYELSGQTRRFAGYACRSADGPWSVQAHLELPNKVRGTQFAPASGDNDAALDAAIRAGMDGDTLSVGEESKLIADHWVAGSK